MEEQREENSLHIEDALEPVHVPVVHSHVSIEAAAKIMTAAHAQALVVQLWDGSWYAMTASELTGASATMTPDTPVERVLKSDRTPVLFPDLPLDNALRHFPRWPLLPVQNRANKGTLEGVLTLNGVLKRYQQH
jgi:CIC family chloride channel protein